jgi:hypothetical protein
MPKYEVLAKSFIDGKVHEEGAVIEYDGFPGSNLKPLDKAAEDIAKQVPSDDVQAKRMKQTADTEAPLEPLKPKK